MMRSRCASVRRMANAVRMGLVLGLSGLLPASAWSQSSEADSLRAKWRIPLPPGYLDVPVQPRSFPSMNSSTPSAFSPEWGEVYAGVGYQRNTRPVPGSRTLNKEDGVAVVGFGLGRARTVALEVEYASFSTIRSGFFSVGALSFKVSHLFENGWAVASGAERVVTVGREGDGGKAYFGAASKVFFVRDDGAPFSAVGVTVGAGDGRFRRITDVFANKRTVNAFGAVGVRVIEAIGLIADWNGQDLTVAASIVPLRCLPVVISPALTDMTGSAQSPRRFVIGVGAGTNVTRRPRLPRSCF